MINKTRVSTPFYVESYDSKVVVLKIGKRGTWPYVAKKLLQDRQPKILSQKALKNIEQTKFAKEWDPWLEAYVGCQTFASFYPFKNWKRYTSCLTMDWSALP